MKMYGKLTCRCPQLLGGITLLILITGCGGTGIPTGCPEDLVVPEDMEVLGANHDQELFILRLRTDNHRIEEVVSLFRTGMQNNGWELKVDSATDKNGGELTFSKEAEERMCRVFITHASGGSEGNKAVHVNINCDRQRQAG